VMGTTVLDPGVPIRKGLHVYAHNLRGTPGGVALLVINNDRDAARTLRVPTAARRYTLSASPLQSTRVELNVSVPRTTSLTRDFESHTSPITDGTRDESDLGHPGGSLARERTRRRDVRPSRAL
jgi:hypothetical protein